MSLKSPEEEEKEDPQEASAGLDAAKNIRKDAALLPVLSEPDDFFFFYIQSGTNNEC